MKWIIILVKSLDKKLPLEKFDLGHWNHPSTYSIIILAVILLVVLWVLFASYQARKELYTDAWAESILNYNHESDFKEKVKLYSEKAQQFLDLNFKDSLNYSYINYAKKFTSTIIYIFFMLHHFFIVGFLSSFIIVKAFKPYLVKILGSIKFFLFKMLGGAAEVLAYNKKLLLIPELILFSWIIVLLILAVIRSDALKKKPSYIYANILKETFKLLYAVLSILTILLLLLTINKKNFSYSFFMFDIYTIYMKILVLSVVMGLLACLQTSHKRSRTNFFELPIVVTFLTLFCFLSLSSFDLWATWICLEGISLCVVFLIAFNHNSEDSSHYASKYLVLGSASSGLFAFGSSMIFGVITTANYEQINKFLRNMTFVYSLKVSGGELPIKSGAISTVGLNSLSIILGFGLVLITFSLLFKLGAAPLHQITITIYKNSTWGIIYMLSVGIKIVVLAISCRIFFYVFSDFKALWTCILQFSGVFTLFIGTLGAFGSKNLKEFFSYSSLVHLSWMLFSISTGLFEGLTSLLVFLFYHALSMSAIFLILNFTLSEKDNFPISGFNDLKKIRFDSGLHLVVFILSIVSLAGIPPTPGFFAKFMLLNSLLLSENYFITIIIMLMQVVAYPYHLRLILLCFSGLTNSEKIFKRPSEYISNFITNYFIYGYNYNVALIISSQLLFFSFISVLFIKSILGVAIVIAKSCIFVQKL